MMTLDNLEVVTLFVEDIDDARSFYAKVFAVETVYEDPVCSVLRFGGIMINLLQATEAPQLVEPAPVAPVASGSRVLFTIKVDDVDAVCDRLRDQGVRLLNGPVDRPWGRRTAAFADPSGHVWEVAQEIA